MSYFPLALGTPMGELITHVNFGEWLKAMRQQRGFSLRSLAEAAGVSHVSVDKAERGGGVRDSTLELLVRALAGPDASPEEAQELLMEARRVRAGLPPEIEREAWHEDTLEVAHFYNGIADPRMRERVKRIMMSAVEIFDEEPEDAGPSGNRTD